MMSYQFLKKIEDDSNLAKNFNRVLGKLGVVRIMSAPATFSMDDDRMRNLFYDTCLWEMYLHGVVKRLRDWEKVLIGYRDEFQSSWRYYAASRRLESIRKYGGEGDDYNLDGSVRTVTTDKDLVIHTVMGELYMDDWRDIVQETRPEDIMGLCAALLADASLSVMDVLKECTGKEIPMYKRDERGEMRKVGFGERTLDKAVKQDEADVLSTFILDVCTLMNIILDRLREMPKDKDNGEELGYVLELPRFLLNIEDADLLRQVIEGICKRAGG